MVWPFREIVWKRWHGAKCHRLADIWGKLLSPVHQKSQAASEAVAIANCQCWVNPTGHGGSCWMWNIPMLIAPTSLWQVESNDNCESFGEDINAQFDCRQLWVRGWGERGGDSSQLLASSTQKRRGADNENLNVPSCGTVRIHLHTDFFAGIYLHYGTSCKSHLSFTIYYMWIHFRLCCEFFSWNQFILFFLLWSVLTRSLSKGDFYHREIRV